MKYSELTPEEINALCAEVMGFTKCLTGTSGELDKPEWYLAPPDGTYMREPAVDDVPAHSKWNYHVPNYLEDMNLCIPFMENMVLFSPISYVNDGYGNRHKDKWMVANWKANSIIYADTPQEAIIRAVLIANNLVEED